jgi:hypothetical protein
MQPLLLRNAAEYAFCRRAVVCSTRFARPAFVKGRTGLTSLARCFSRKEPSLGLLGFVLGTAAGQLVGAWTYLRTKRHGWRGRSRDQFGHRHSSDRHIGLRSPRRSRLGRWQRKQLGCVCLPGRLHGTRSRSSLPGPPPQAARLTSTASYARVRKGGGADRRRGQERRGRTNRCNCQARLFG